MKAVRLHQYDERPAVEDVPEPTAGPNQVVVKVAAVGICGVYTYEVAETKVTQVMDFARKHQHPLQCVMEKK